MLSFPGLGRPCIAGEARGLGIEARPKAGEGRRLVLVHTSALSPCRNSEVSLGGAVNVGCR